MTELDGKVALVTGGTSGIGFATARALIDAGAAVGVNGPTEALVSEALARLASDRAVAVPADIGTVAGCEAAIDGVTNAFGRLDILVNSAGLLLGATIEESDESVWARVIDVNLKGVFFCSRHALTHLEKTRGAIVNVSSIEGLMGAPGARSTRPPRVASSP